MGDEAVGAASTTADWGLRSIRTAQSGGRRWHDTTQMRKQNPGVVFVQNESNAAVCVCAARVQVSLNTWAGT